MKRLMIIGLWPDDAVNYCTEKCDCRRYAFDRILYHRGGRAARERICIPVVDRSGATTTYLDLPVTLLEAAVVYLRLDDGSDIFLSNTQMALIANEVERQRAECAGTGLKTLGKWFESGLPTAEDYLEPGDEVAITIMEHHSNLIPWQQACRAAGAKLVYLYPTKTGELTDAEIAEKIGPRTKIVACTQVSNVLGCRVPVEKLGAAVHARGGYLVVDAAQSVPHMPVDVHKLGADFLAFSAHKALGPMGVGVLWGRLELLEAMPPFLTGGEMIDSVTEQDAVWAPVPEKFEAGTQDAAGIYATGAALDYLVNQVGYDTVQAREQALVHYAMSRMVELPYVEIIGSIYWDRHHGVISFNVRGVHPHDVASILDMQGVCIRAGHHCAQPLLTWLGVENLACCRASLAFYNDKHDVDAFIDGLETVYRTFN